MNEEMLKLIYSKAKIPKTILNRFMGKRKRKKQYM